MGQAAPEGLTPRPLLAGDLDQVCAIERASFGTPWTRPLFEEELKRPQLCHWLVLDGPAGAVTAYGGFWLAVDEAHFTNIAVHPDWRGRGLGRRLLLALLEKARGLGCVRATLEVRPSNAAALGLYQSEGFSVAAMRPRYYTDDGEDALILWKQGL
ncbi:MAG TPA: ribosomal protein S18-alanine N-acetyltransferase [bacterium]|nr:ribosomal protein S18-alanine N-acetyltransferase [bacterium]